jgi:hypothetical protein
MNSGCLQFISKILFELDLVALLGKFSLEGLDFVGGPPLGLINH